MSYDKGSTYYGHGLYVEFDPLPPAGNTCGSRGSYHTSWRWSPGFTHSGCSGVGTTTNAGSTVRTPQCFCGYEYTLVQWLLMCGLTAARDDGDTWLE